VKVVEALVNGGKASAGPPLGPALGPLGVNIGNVVAKINEVTKDFEGMQVPVKVIVDEETKEFRIEVGTPPTSALLKKELGVEKLSSKPNEEKVGDLKFEQVVKVARAKLSSLNTDDLKLAVKQVLGTCVSAGITVDGKEPKEVIKEVEEGKYDGMLKE